MPPRCKVPIDGQASIQLFVRHDAAHSWLGFTRGREYYGSPVSVAFGANGTPASEDRRQVELQAVAPTR
jgi:hypothetical protein